MVDLTNADVLAVLTRAPSSGGKSRLFAALNRPPDVELLSAFLLDTIDGATIPDVTVVIAVTPRDACDEVRGLVPKSPGIDAGGHGRRTAARGCFVIPQPDGDLGARMHETMRQLFAAGARAVVLIGSDVPAIGGDAIRAAFQYVRNDPRSLVLGPTPDGGYYLIGAARAPAVFHGIAWGTSTVLSDTIAAAAAAGYAVALVAPLADVDDLERLRAVPARAARTAGWVRRHIEKE